MASISATNKDVYESKENEAQTAGSTNSIDAVLAVVKKSKVLSSLYTLASQVQIKALGHPLKVKHGSSNTEFGGNYNTSTGEILLSKNRSFAEKISILVFEMMNAATRNDFLSIQDAVYQGKIETPEKYTCAIELLEYQNLQRYWQVRTLCATQESWVFPEFYNRFENFEAYMKVQIEAGHTEFYQKSFKEIRSIKEAATILSLFKSS